MTINPFWCYIFSFGLALIVYQLGWSKLYPSLSYSLTFFILVTFVFHFLSGWLWQKGTAGRFEKLDHKARNPVLITLIICFFWGVEFVYAGGIPLLKILLREDFNYVLFGVPSLHVLLVTFSSFYTVYLFHQFLIHREKKILILFIMNLSAGLLIYNRAMLIFNLTASFFLLLSSMKSISLKAVIVMCVSGMISLYLFGVLGVIRQSSKIKAGYRTDLFLKVSQPTPQFRYSIIPFEFFWSYIYLTSPMANLQTNCQNTQYDSTSTAVLKQVNNEMLPDFISKRTNTWMGWTRPEELMIDGPFNVSTVYSRSFSYQHWRSMVIMAIFVLIVPWMYRWLLPQSPYALTGIALLATMYLFLVFDNTIRFTGLAFQLVYPWAVPALLEFRLWLMRRISGRV